MDLLSSPQTGEIGSLIINHSNSVQNEGRNRRGHWRDRPIHRQWPGELVHYFCGHHQISNPQICRLY